MYNEYLKAPEMVHDTLFGPEVTAVSEIQSDSEVSTTFHLY